MTARTRILVCATWGVHCCLLAGPAAGAIAGVTAMIDRSIGSGTWATMFASSFTVVLMTGWFVSGRASLDLMPDGTIMVRNLIRCHEFDRHEVQSVTGSQYPYWFIRWRMTGSVPLVAVHLRDGRRVKIMATASDNAETLSRSLALLRSAGLRDLPTIAVLRFGRLRW